MRMYLQQGLSQQSTSPSLVPRQAFNYLNILSAGISFSLICSLLFQFVLFGKTKLPPLLPNPPPAFPTTTCFPVHLITSPCPWNSTRPHHFHTRFYGMDLYIQSCGVAGPPYDGRMQVCFLSVWQTSYSCRSHVSPRIVSWRRVGLRLHSRSPEL